MLRILLKAILLEGCVVSFAHGSLGAVPRNDTLSSDITGIMLILSISFNYIAGYLSTSGKPKRLSPPYVPAESPYDPFASIQLPRQIVINSIPNARGEWRANSVGISI